MICYSTLLLDTAGTYPVQPCRWCGGYHTGVCSRIRAVEYHPNGVVKRVELWCNEPVWTWPRTTEQLGNVGQNTCLDLGAQTSPDQYLNFTGRS